MAPSLELRCLGIPLLLAPGGDQVRFRTRKHFAVLIRLALEPGKKLTRDHLMDFLWRDAPARLARHSLAQAISVVKAKVGREHLAIQRSAIALAPGVVDVDIHHLGSADVRVRGEFLDGFEVPGARPFEEWKDEWRAKLAPKVRDCLVRQMDAGRRIGDFATVERHAQVLYELDPLSEDAVRGVMEARAWVGDRSNALKAYARFEQQLAQELDAKPSADLARVAGLLREGRPTPSFHRVRGPGGDRSPHERAEKRFEAETLIGREREFSALYDTWLEVRQRSPRIVVLTGDPGVGKTTLTNAFVSTCQIEGAVVARAQAYDAERELPFAVLGELVKQLTIQRAIGSAEPEALSELSRITTEILLVFPGVPKPVEWASEVMPLRLADAFLKAVTAASDESPVVMVVDDIHAADNASAAILHVVARKFAGTRVLLILAGRSSELRTATAPAALTTDTSIAGLRAVEVDVLSAEASSRLVAQLAADGAGRRGEPPAERILRAGSGNPLALELLTREWVAHGPESLLRDLEALDRLPAATLGIPRAIRVVFERQARRLDARTRAALDLAAVLGRRLADLELYQAVSLTPGQAAEALSRLREEGLLREVHGDLEFRNELIRGQAYYAVAGPARQHLHKRVGERLATRSDQYEMPNLEIAWHYVRGRNAAEAVPFVLGGAAAALKTGAPYEAEQVLQVILQASPSSPRKEQLRVARLLLGRALIDQSKAVAAMPVLQSLSSEPELSPRDAAELAQLQATGVYLTSREAGDLQCEAADRALSAAHTAGHLDLLARALFLNAQAGTETGEESRIRSAMLELEQLLSDPVARKDGFIHYAIAYCNFAFGDLRKASSELEESIRLLAGPTDFTTLSSAYNGHGLCKQFLCEFDGASKSYEEGLRLARRMGNDARASITAGNLCGLYSIMGRFDKAIEYGHLSIELGARRVSQPKLVASYMNLAEVLILSGKPDEAQESLDAAAQSLAETSSWKTRVVYYCEAASIALMQGNLGSALESARLMEKTAWGRESTVPEGGMFNRLRIFRMAYDKDYEAARQMAERFRNDYEDRNLIFYLDAVATNAWIERLTIGEYSGKTRDELALFGRLGAIGKHAALVAQGFLPYERGTTSIS